MNRRIVSWILKCYPAGWRSEYGAEMEDLLAREPLTVSRIWNVLWGALRERARQPGIRFIIHLTLGWTGLFVVSVLCSPLLWRLIAAPVLQALRDQKVDPPNLVATLPWESVLIIWLGIPLLGTLFAIYPASLLLACRRFAVSRPMKAAAACSAMLYAAGFAAGLFAWHFGSFERLLGVLQSSQDIQAVSVSQCFGLLTSSTLGTAVALQVPLLLLHSWRSRVRSTLSSA